MELHVFPIPIPTSHLPLHPIPLGLPSAPGQSTCLMHPTWAGFCFTIDNIHAVLSKHPTLAFSHRVQKSEAHVDWNIPGVKFRVIEYLGLGSFLKELNTIHQFVVFSSKIILAFWQLYLRQIFILLNQLKEKKLEPISVSFPEYVLIWGV